jgi:hypothetical protein
VTGYPHAFASWMGKILPLSRVSPTLCSVCSAVPCFSKSTRSCAFSGMSGCLHSTSVLCQCFLYQFRILYAFAVLLSAENGFYLPVSRLASAELSVAETLARADPTFLAIQAGGRSRCRILPLSATRDEWPFHPNRGFLAILQVPAIMLTCVQSCTIYRILTLPLQDAIRVLHIDCQLCTTSNARR